MLADFIWNNILILPTLITKFYKLASLMMACALIAALGSMIPATAPIFAQTNAIIKPDIDNPEYIDSVLPGAVSDLDLILVKQVVLADKQVQSIINGQDYTFMAADYYTDNILATPVVWNPEINIAVGNNITLTALVDLKTRTVEYIHQAPLTYGCTPGTDCLKHSFSIDWLNTIATAPNYLEARLKAVTYVQNANPIHGGQSLFLDAVMSPNPSGAQCLATDYFNNYWAQAGLNWNQAVGGGADTKPIYTDTRQTADGVNGCVNQYSALSYISGHFYKFQIKASTNNHTTHKGWTIVGTDVTSGAAFTYQATADVQNGIVLTGTQWTNVMFENRESQASEPTWYNNYGASPTANTAKYSTNGGTTLSNWPADSTLDLKKTGTSCTTPSSTTPSAVMGTAHGLQAGGTATWDMITAYNNIPACGT